MTRACSAWLKALAISASAIGAMAALANPSRARATNSMPPVCAAPASNDAPTMPRAPKVNVTRDAASKHKGAEHQLAKGDGYLHDYRRCPQVAAHRAQRKVCDCA